MIILVQEWIQSICTSCIIQKSGPYQLLAPDKKKEGIEHGSGHMYLTNPESKRGSKRFSCLTIR